MVTPKLPLFICWWVVDPWLQCWCTQALVVLIEPEIDEQELESDLLVTGSLNPTVAQDLDIPSFPFWWAMSAKGWTSNKLMLDVGDVAFPPGQQATEGSSVPLPETWSQIPNMNQHEGYFRVFQCISTSSSVSSQTQGRQLNNLLTLTTPGSIYNNGANVNDQQQLLSIAYMKPCTDLSLSYIFAGFCRIWRFGLDWKGEAEIIGTTQG